MANRKSSFLHAHTPWWQQPAGMHPSYTWMGARISQADLAMMPTPSANAPVYPPSSGEATSVGISPVEPDTAPTFTCPGSQGERRRERISVNGWNSPSPDLHPGYGDGFVIHKSTEDMRRQARAVIFDDVSPVPSSESSEEELESDEEWSDKIVDCHPEKRRTLRAKIARKIKNLKGRFEQKIQKVEHIAYRRDYGRVRRGVNKVKPLKNMIKSITGPNGCLKPIRRHRSLNASTIPLARVVRMQPKRPSKARLSRGLMREPARSSTLSLTGPVITERDNLIDADEALMSGGLAIIETVREGDEVNDGGPIDPEVSSNSRSSLDKLLSISSACELSEEDIQNLIEDFKRMTERHTAELQRIRSLREVSIAGQIDAFKFDKVVSLEIIARFPVTMRVILKTKNFLNAQRDLLHLENIWSQIVGQSPNGLFDEPLRVLSRQHAERICKLLGHSLETWILWATFVEASAAADEGAMDVQWWHDFMSKLDNMGSPDVESLWRQLNIVGEEYIKVSWLDIAMQSLNDLILVRESQQMSVIEESGKKRSDMKCVRHDSKTDVDAVELGLLVPVMKETETTMENTGEAPAEQVAIASVPEPRLLDGQNRTSLTTADKAAHIEELVLEEACNIPLPEEEPACTQSASLSSKIMEDMLAELDAAVGGSSTSPVPHPIKERHPSQLPLPLVPKKSLPVSSKRQSTEAEKKKESRRMTSVPLNDKNGWFSAEHLTDFDPSKVVVPKEYANPSGMAKKARGKPARSSTMSSRPTPKVTTSRVPPRPTKKPPTKMTRGSPSSNVTPAPSSAITTRSSTPPQRVETSASKVARVPPSSAVIVPVARSAGIGRQSKIPLLRNKAYMPGAYPESDAGGEE